MKEYETFDAELHLTNGEIITIIDANKKFTESSKTTVLSKWANNEGILHGMSCTMWSENEVLVLNKYETDLGCDIIINVNHISYIKKINEREMEELKQCID